MSNLLLNFVAILVIAVLGYWLGRSRAVAVAQGQPHRLHSLPGYHGMFIAAVAALIMLFAYVAGTSFVEWLGRAQAIAQLPAEVAADPLKLAVAFREIHNATTGAAAADSRPEYVAAGQALNAVNSIGGAAILGSVIVLGLLTVLILRARVSEPLRARNAFERIVLVLLLLCAAVAVLTTIGIVFSVLFETVRFFFDPTIAGKPSITDFLFGLDWNPQEALRADQGEIKSAFGFVPLLVGSLLITTIAILVAGPLGLLSAIYLSEYAGPRMRAVAKPVLEILAGIPTVVLGFFAALTVAPLIRGTGESFGLDVASESALAAGLVMGMMIIPFISSLSDDVINAVPQSLRDGSYAMGATRSETIKRVLLPAAFAGIVSAFMLAISRAIGETMIVVMAAGLAANLTANPLDAVTTITVQIKTILVGDQEFNSAKTLSAFALGFALFFITLILNFIAHAVVKRYREQYD